MKVKRKIICESYQLSLRRAKEHTRKVFRKIDAENQKLDQMELKL